MSRYAQASVVEHEDRPPTITWADFEPCDEHCAPDCGGREFVVFERVGDDWREHSRGIGH